MAEPAPASDRSASRARPAEQLVGVAAAVVPAIGVPATAMLGLDGQVLVAVEVDRPLMLGRPFPQPVSRGKADVLAHISDSSASAGGTW